MIDEINKSLEDYADKVNPSIYCRIENADRIQLDGFFTKEDVIEICKMLEPYVNA